MLSLYSQDINVQDGKFLPSCIAYCFPLFTRSRTTMPSEFSIPAFVFWGYELVFKFMEIKNGGSVSRFLCRIFIRFLSFIYAVYPPASGGQPSSAGIHDLAGRRCVLYPCRRGYPWALTPRFHPCRPFETGGGCFLLRCP